MMYVPENKEALKRLIEQDIPGDQIDVSRITDMSYLFRGTYYNHPLDSWDVSQVTHMEYMFYNSKYNHPLGSWDIRRVKSMEDMFTESQYNCTFTYNNFLSNFGYFFEIQLIQNSN